MIRSFYGVTFCVAILLVGSSITSTALSGTAPNTKSDLAKVRLKAIEYLKARGQSADGSFSPQIGIGVTALAATALMENGVSPSDPVVSKAVEIVAKSARADGGIYAEASRLKMYETCVAIVCLNRANDQGQYSELLSKAAAYVRNDQFDEGEGRSPDDLEYGGAGYGGGSRPDLSNTAFLIESLQSLKSAENDPAIAKALQFVSRCQNLESEYNTSPAAEAINDGGFYYTVAGGGSSPAGRDAEGGLRSYGSMTYAGFKSMIYAGLDADDPRVKAAKEWISINYTVKSNPGMGDAGLYYYYNLFAKALAASGLRTIQDAQGVEHDWRAELVEHLKSLQSEDGSWTNKNTKWMEGDANLATAFCLLALSHCDESTD